jgi:hypothetical protein
MKHLIIPDTQVKPGVPLDHLDWCGQYIAYKRPEVIVMLGDFADMESLCSYDTGKKSFEGRRYRKDVDVVHEAMERLVTPIKKQRGYQPKMHLTLGNHEERILRAVESDPKLEGMLSIDDLGYEDYGWTVHEYLRPHVINGVAYSHYFTSGARGFACSSARSIMNKHHMSCVAGHQQGRDIAYGKRGDGRGLTTIIAGSFYQHDEKYMPYVNNRHWRGIFVLHEVQDGSFDEMAVSLNYLKRKFS